MMSIHLKKKKQKKTMHMLIIHCPTSHFSLICIIITVDKISTVRISMFLVLHHMLYAILPSGTVPRFTNEIIPPQIATMMQQIQVNILKYSALLVFCRITFVNCVLSSHFFSDVKKISFTLYRAQKFVTGNFHELYKNLRS